MEVKSTNKPLVSIVIPYFNLGKFIEETIHCCLNQTYHNIEIIIINDGSTDKDSIKKLDELKTKYKQIRFIDQKKLSLPITRNNGVKIARGRYICCLDADDIILPSYIEQSMRVLEKNPQAGFVATWIKLFGERNELLKTPSFCPAKLLIGNCFSSASVFKKSIWKKVDGYSLYMNKGCEDWDFWIKIVSLGFRWEVIKKPLFLYRIRKNSFANYSKRYRYQLIKTIIKKNLKIYQSNLDDIIIELHKYNDIILNTKAWRYMDKIRFFVNKLQNFINQN